MYLLVVTFLTLFTNIFSFQSHLLFIFIFVQSNLIPAKKLNNYSSNTIHIVFIFIIPYFLQFYT